jgi:membrane glycosyltransferase
MLHSPQKNGSDSAGGLVEKVQPPLAVRHGHRVFFFYSFAVLLTGLMTLFFADLLWRTGWSTSRTLLMLTFIPLFFLSAVGCLNSLYGFTLRGLNEYSPVNSGVDWSEQEIGNVSTAVVFPIYNEDARRVLEGLRVTYLSLKKTGHVKNFDFFLLSDSTQPAKWADEERLWYETVKDLGALGRIFYRRRMSNEGRKSGNIRDFLNSWGGRYRYFIILDADSVLRGDTMVNLVRMMEANPGVGLIQTVPALVNAESLFARIQQFANRFYAPIFITGMDYWSQDFGNYWGHNAIVRTEPFMQYCDLPRLPGRRPFGGHILSHDFVEAALLLKANWKVWIAYNLGGSYEESPPGILENARRDRRWCQGNLQHGLVLFVKGLRGISRLHLLQGIFGYLAGPLWFVFLVLFYWMWMSHKVSGLSLITVHSWSSFLTLSGAQEAALIFLICMGVLLLPRLLALIDIALDPKRQRAFGGMASIMASTIGETIFSTLHAPMQMVLHTKFVVTILLGMHSDWEPQRRKADGTSWPFALRHAGMLTVVGLIWGGVIAWLAPSILWWFVPILAGLLLAVPLCVWTSRASWGERARKMGLFLTPEETMPPAELGTLRLRMAMTSDAEDALDGAPELAEIILDPYANALHVALLRENSLIPDNMQTLKRIGAGMPPARTLGERLLTEGSEFLKPAEKMLILSDPDTLSWLHRQAWFRANNQVNASWRAARRRFSYPAAVGEDG